MRFRARHAGRSPSVATASRSASVTRRGASNATSVASSPATAARADRRAAAVRGRKPDEAERVRRQAGRGQRGRHRRRSRHAGHADARLDRGADQAVARIAETSGVPASDHEGDIVPGAKALEQLAGARLLVVVVVADRARARCRGAAPAWRSGACPRRPRPTRRASVARARGTRSSAIADRHGDEVQRAGLTIRGLARRLRSARCPA